MSVNSVSPWCVGGVLAWAGAVGLGFFQLGEYHHRPGAPGSPADSWPSGTPVAPDPARPTLLMFLHPRCPCSRASVAELASILAGRPGVVAATAILFRPESPASARDWGRPAGPEVDAAAVPGLRLVNDPGGATARKFGVETSGHVLLYDPAGRRLFSGGLTPSRGHRGDNPGLTAVLSHLDGAAVGPARGPVFGCPTTSPRADAATEAAR